MGSLVEVVDQARRAGRRRGHRRSQRRRLCHPCALALCHGPSGEEPDGGGTGRHGEASAQADPAAVEVLALQDGLQARAARQHPAHGPHEAASGHGGQQVQGALRRRHCSVFSVAAGSAALVAADSCGMTASAPSSNP